MEFTDMDIVKKINQDKAQPPLDIYQDYIFINEEKFKYEDISLLRNKLIMPLPNTFRDMKHDIAKVKYPSSDRPSIIKSNEIGSVSYGLSLTEKRFLSSDVEEATQTFYGMIKKLYPNYKYINREIIELESSLFGYFDFISPGLDEDLYQIFAFTSLNNQFLQIVFNSRARNAKEWFEVNQQVFKNIKMER